MPPWPPRMNWNDLIAVLEAAEGGSFYDFTTKCYAQAQIDEKGFRVALKALNRAVDEEILKRLLALNLERAAEEKQATKTSARKRSSRTKTIDEMI
jgi:hypothetical protein